MLVKAIVFASLFSLVYAEYCNNCPSIMRTSNGQCQTVYYTCKCDCSLGCSYKTEQVSKGFTVSNLNIEQVNQQFDVCQSCFVFWAGWLCTVENQDGLSVDIDVCLVSQDYENNPNVCLINSPSYPQVVSSLPSPSPSPAMTKSPVVSPSPSPAMLRSPVMSPSPSPAMLRSPIVSPSPSPAMARSPIVTPSPSPAMARSPVVTPSPSLRNRTSIGNETDIITDNDIRAASIAFAWWIITLIVVGCLVILGLLICLIMCCVQCCRR
jgi:hypothetical protein